MLYIHGFYSVCDSEVAYLKIWTLCARHYWECRMQNYNAWVLTEIDRLGKLVLKQHFLFLIEINYSYIQRLTYIIYSLLQSFIELYYPFTFACILI